MIASKSASGDTPSAHRFADVSAVLLLTLGIPLFFPLLWQGNLPGPFHVGGSDTPVFFEPYALDFIRALKSGENPFWSHPSSFGAPTLLTLGTGALHPFHLLHLMMPDWLAFAVGWWARLSLFNVYLHFYLREVGVRPWVALSATLSLSFGSMFINYSQEIIGYVMAFAPMALFHLERLRRGITVLHLTLGALAFAMMILGGFPSVILYLSILLGLYVLCTRFTARTMAWSALAFVAGAGLTLPAIVETLRFFLSSGYDPARREALFLYTPPLTTAFNLVSPAVFGDIFSYVQAGGRDFYGRLLGAGIVTVPLALVLAVRSMLSSSRLEPRAIFWVTAFLVTLSIYFNALGVKALIHHVPVLNEHPLTRLQVIIAMSAAAMWAMLLENALSRPAIASPPRRWTAILASASAILIVTFGGIALTQQGAYVVRNSLIHLSLGLASMAALAAVVIWRKRLAPALVVASIAATGVATSIHYVSYYKPDQYYPKSALIRHVEENLLPGGRILDLGDILFQGKSIAYGISSVTKHWFPTPELRNWVARLSDTQLHVGLTHDKLDSIDVAIAWPELRKMHVQFIAVACVQVGALTDKDARGDGNSSLAAQDGDVCLLDVLYDGRPLKMPRHFSGSGYSEYKERAGRISLAGTRRTVKIPVRFDPGWRVTSGHASIGESDENLILLSLEKPDRIELAYRPKNFALLLGVGAFAFMLFVAGAWRLERQSGAI